MGLGTLAARAAAQIISYTWFNDVRNLLTGALVGRNASSGAPEAGNNLGTATYPWGDLYAENLILDGSLVSFSDTENPPYKIISGKKRSTSNQLDFLRASGSGATATLSATATNLVLSINGTSVTFAADVAITGLTLAPSSQNTATVNHSIASNQEASRTFGERDDDSQNFSTIIGMTSAGTNITNLVGKYAAFKLGTEYFIAYVSSSTVLTNIRRGYFINSSGAPVLRQKYTDGATITLLKLAWVYAKDDGTSVDIAYTNPVYSATQPSAPASGDYWFDTTTRTLKLYNGSSFAVTTRMLIGVLCSDATNCIGSRSFDVFSTNKTLNTVTLERLSNSVIQSKYYWDRVSVMGKVQEFKETRLSWDMASHLAASTENYNATEQASTTYYFYISDQGETKISDVSPYYRADLGAYYHPFNTWRCVGRCDNDGSSNFADEYTLFSFGENFKQGLPTDQLAQWGNLSGSSSGNQGPFTGTTLTDLSISIDVKARRNKPVLIIVTSASSGTPAGAGLGAFQGARTTATNTAGFFIVLKRDGAVLRSWTMNTVATTGANNTVDVSIPASLIFLDDTATYGKHTYSLWVSGVAAADKVSAYTVQLQAMPF